MKAIVIHGIGPLTIAIGIAAAINGAATNTGVQATLINGVDGARLVLTANKTGADSAITVGVTILVIHGLFFQRQEAQ